MKIQCSCDHIYQDLMYGKGIRIGNPVNKTAETGKVRDWRCTVCGKITNLIKPKELSKVKAV